MARLVHSYMPTPNPKFVAGVVRQALAQCIPDPSSAGHSVSPSTRLIFESAQAQAIKQEIIEVGRKLWAREYVDGNGGNISYRISHDHVLCTPTMVSKADLTLDDICLVSLDNQRVLGTRAHTSEILLHLEIYKAVPTARAVIHCHPPHATAYAITGLIPPGEIIPEQEVFVGPVATAPYETPGTKSFAETVLSYIRNHNTVLLENHGVVCWADTVTHAEWCVEVIDTYCRTLILASHLGTPIRRIPKEKIEGLLAIKRRLGLPDARLHGAPREHINDQPEGEKQDSQSLAPSQLPGDHVGNSFESLVSRITAQVIQFVSSQEE